MGAGTLGLELEDQAGVPDAVGGGGLIGGIAARFCTRTRVIDVEPELVPTPALVLAVGAPAAGIAADLLAPPDRRVRVCDRVALRRVVLVTDDAIAAAQRALWTALRLASESQGPRMIVINHTGSVRPAPRIAPREHQPTRPSANASFA